MRRVAALFRIAVLVAAVGIAVTVIAAGTAGSSRDAAIKPGKGIGKVELGMTLAQVKRALGGPPFSTDRRTNFGARGRYIEYTWEVGSLIRYTWRVGLRSTRRNGPLRVVRVSSSVPGHRTPEGLGVGSRARDIAQRFPDVLCEFRNDGDQGWSGTWMVVKPRSGGMTAFRLDTNSRSGHERVYEVIAVLVQRSWLNDDDQSPGVKCPDEHLQG